MPRLSQPCRYFGYPQARRPLQPMPPAVRRQGEGPPLLNRPGSSPTFARIRDLLAYNRTLPAGERIHWGWAVPGTIAFFVVLVGGAVLS